MDEKRGRGRDPDAAREAFLSAAETIFARAGFDGARVEEIATKAGYNKALLFHYFGDKLGLYQAIVTRHCDAAAHGNARVLGPAVPPDDKPLTRATVRRFFEVAVGWSFDFYQTHPKCARVFTWEAAEGWNMVRRITQSREKAEWIEKVQRFMRRAQDAGFLRADLDPAMLIAMVITMTQHYHVSLPRYEMMFSGADFSSSEALAHAREQMVQFVVHGAMTAIAGAADGEAETDKTTETQEESQTEGKQFDAVGI
jgi:TetR/AcrR family transcriptional regulator